MKAGANTVYKKHYKNQIKKLYNNLNKIYKYKLSYISFKFLIHAEKLIIKQHAILYLLLNMFNIQMRFSYDPGQ